MHTPLRPQRLHQDAKQLIRSQTEFIAADPENAGITGPKHLDPGARTDAELFQTMNVVRLTKDAQDGSRLAGGQILEENGVGDHGGGYEMGRCEVG